LSLFPAVAVHWTVMVGESRTRPFSGTRMPPEDDIMAEICEPARMELEIVRIRARSLGS